MKTVPPSKIVGTSLALGALVAITGVLARKEGDANPVNNGSPLQAALI